MCFSESRAGVEHAVFQGPLRLKEGRPGTRIGTLGSTMLMLSEVCGLPIRTWPGTRLTKWQMFRSSVSTLSCLCFCGMVSAYPDSCSVAGSVGWEGVSGLLLYIK